MISIGAVTAAVVGAVGWWAVPVLFGEQYRASLPIMAVLVLAIPLRFGSASVEALLITGGRLRWKVTLQGIGAAAYVAGLAIAIPMLGVTGAAVATVLAEALLLALYWWCVAQKVVRGAELPSWSQIRSRLAPVRAGSP